MKLTAFIGYDIPLALDVKLDIVLPILDLEFKKIEIDGDILHLVEEENITFIQKMLAILNTHYDIGLTLDIQPLQDGEIKSVDGKLFRRYDLQDETDFEIETPEEMKKWLVGLWNDNPDKDMSDEEHEEFMQNILSADLEELSSMIAGVGYTFEAHY